MKTILLNPGPVNVSERVRAALTGADLCHREPEFYDLQDAIRARLLDIFDVRGGYTSVLLTGSGTAMVEAMIASGVPESGRLLVMQNGGPVGAPGMPEAGNIPIPTRLLQQGVRDMVRISDARMSGTAYGTVVLHTAPEAADGGPLAAVRSGDFIELDVPNRRLHLDISDAELATRMKAWQRPAPPLASGYWKLYVDHVLQADRGADLDFLVGKRGSFVPRDNH